MSKRSNPDTLQVLSSSDTSLDGLKGLSKAVISGLAKLGIRNAQELLLHLPLRYIDETRITPIRDLCNGHTAQIQGRVSHCEVTYKPRKMLVVTLEDESGQMHLRFLHFYPSQLNMFQEGRLLRVFGEVRKGFWGNEMVHPQCRVVEASTAVSATLTPVYPTTSGLSQIALRKAVFTALEQDEMAETLPEWVYSPFALPDYASSIRMLHQPDPEIALETLENRTLPAWRRLALDELLAQQLSMRKHYTKRRSGQAPSAPVSSRLVPALLQSLKFTLTEAQCKVVEEISHDLMQSYPMQRLLQGDVGSGKTIVACVAALQMIEHGWQVVVMAPTEILAEQHFKKFTDWLGLLGVGISWLSGSQPKKEREAALSRIQSGQAMLAIGTHALFQDAVVFQRLGLVIVDEQHRFGVQQRLALRQKGQPEPHQLMMSATPIPRTLSMSYYADLDVSVIDALPPGRSPVTTKLVEDSRRQEILQRVREACLEGRQAYWVCPLIEESEALQLQTAQETYAMMQATFPDLQVGLLHGRLRPHEKQTVMQAFAQNAIQLLVATTVIEVGVDVPNASLMVIEHAERMGLSQLHQLRGRVGRGAARSTCILMYQSPLSALARARLKVIYEQTDGFAIAQADLHLRGPGEFLGTRQSGLPMLRIARLEEDEDLLIYARDLSERLIAEYPQHVERHLQRWMRHGSELIKV